MDVSNTPAWTRNGSATSMYGIPSVAFQCFLPGFVIPISHGKKRCKPSKSMPRTKLLPQPLVDSGSNTLTSTWSPCMVLTSLISWFPSFNKGWKHCLRIHWPKTSRYPQMAFSRSWVCLRVPPQIRHNLETLFVSFWKLDGIATTNTTNWVDSQSLLP